MVYATYQYYVQEHLGTLISDELVFEKVARKASLYIDQFTFGRINEGNVTAFPSLPGCVCDMAEVIFRTEDPNGFPQEKKSESIDGYSVTYVTEGTDGRISEEKLRRKLYSIARLHLIHTGLLYCGVDCSC